MLGWSSPRRISTSFRSSFVNAGDARSVRTVFRANARPSSGRSGVASLAHDAVPDVEDAEDGSASPFRRRLRRGVPSSRRRTTLTVPMEPRPTGPEETQRRSKAARSRAECSSIMFSRKVRSGSGDAARTGGWVRRRRTRRRNEGRGKHSSRSGRGRLPNGEETAEASASRPGSSEKTEASGRTRRDREDVGESACRHSIP
mmetsp:Transcript_39618/g.92690  ORF Transcript_39618/g.92690 Transcript_39618/m.92690 type:complete len:201 (+) Transcript_39618:1475-2077(+)